MDTAIEPDSGTPDTVAHELLDMRNAMEKALCYLTTARFNTLHSLLENSQLYSLDEKELVKFPEMIKRNFVELLFFWYSGKFSPPLYACWEYAGLKLPERKWPSWWIRERHEDSAKTLSRLFRCRRNVLSRFRAHLQRNIRLQQQCGLIASYWYLSLILIASTNIKAQTVSFLHIAQSGMAAQKPADVPEEVHWSPILELGSTAR